MDGESLLSLSDVVHDDRHSDVPNHTDEHSPTPDFDSTANLLSSLHDSFNMAEHSSDHLSPEEYSVEVLEREIASLLNQNASAASAALLNAAAQQSQARLELRTNGSSPIQSGHPSDDAASGLNPGLSGIVAALQAIHGRAGIDEPQDPLNKDQQPPTTRTAPAFHSLTASEVQDDELGANSMRHGERGGSAENAPYLYSEEEHDSDSDTLGGPEVAQSSPHPDQDMHSPDSVNGLPSASGSGDYLNDILHQLSGDFDDAPQSDARHSSEPEVSPIIPHTQLQPLLPASPKLPITTITPSVPLAEPVASTSYLPEQKEPKQKSPSSPPARRSKDKDGSPPTCDYEGCGKTFTRRSDLARHMRIHTGERPFVCNFANCGKTFIQRSALHVHSRVHTGEKPHSCEYPGCGKTFGDSSSLARHRRTHTGKRPYKCQEPTCAKTFTRRTTLTTHMRIHDPSYESDPKVKYDFKGKKRKVVEEDEDELAESVRAISAMLQTGSGLPTSGDGTGKDIPIEAHVASISAEIAAAIAQARSRNFEEADDDDDDEGGEESGSGQEFTNPETIVSNMSGIRGAGEGEQGVTSKNLATARPGDDDDDEDSDAFPQPLHSRKAKDTFVSAGTKRKR